MNISLKTCSSIHFPRVKFLSTEEDASAHKSVTIKQREHIRRKKQSLLFFCSIMFDSFIGVQNDFDPIIALAVIYFNSLWTSNVIRRPHISREALILVSQNAVSL